MVLWRLIRIRESEVVAVARHAPLLDVHIPAYLIAHRGIHWWNIEGLLQRDYRIPVDYFCIESKN